ICLFTGLQRGIIIQTSDRLIACGHSPGMLNHWLAFLILARVPQLPAPRSLNYIPYGIQGLIIGVPMGYVLGYVVAMMTDQERWIPGLLLLGAMDSLIIAVLYIYRNRFASQDDSRPFPVMFWALLFSVLGAMIGLIWEINGAILTGSLNALIGLYAASGIHSRIPELTKEASIEVLK
ncbi:MAG: hypothetical protein KDA74_18545, partial [Planctomycetaceae bacterium]|nr:hypothetical protein [Planctomycetaceae bacterium]